MLATGFRKILIAAMLAFAPLPAIAATEAPPGWSAFLSGEFHTAIKEGHTGNSANGLALACRAGLVLGGYRQTGEDAVKTLHSAITDCNQALNQRPDHEVATVSLAIALSFEGKRTREPKFAKAARQLLEAYLQSNPNSTLANGALGAWHSEVSAAGFLARIALGASRKKAAIYFGRAQQLGMQDYALKFEFIKYLAHGGRSDRERAKSAIIKLEKVTPQSAFDRIIQARMELLAAALKADSKRARKAAFTEVAAFQGAASKEIVAAFELDRLSSLSEN